MNNEPVKLLFEHILKSGIKGSSGNITFSLGDTSVELTTRDIIGGAIQDWFGQWLETQRKHLAIQVDTPDNTQKFPDFVINQHSMLEVKCFDQRNGPAFDLSNFGSYISSLVEYPIRLDADYLVFCYSMQDTNITIEDMWLKKIWELTGPSATNITQLQVKRNQPVNIRPKKWYDSNAETFASRRAFVIALNQAALKFSFPPQHNADWINLVSQKYEAATGHPL